MIVDAHTHLLDTGHWPTEWWDCVAEDWARGAPDRAPASIRKKIERGLVDPDGSRMIARMDEAGVDSSVILPIDWGPDFTGTRPIPVVVGHALQLAEAHPGRLIPFGGIDPRVPDAVEMVQDWFDRGIRGLKLYPGCGWNPTSSQAMEIYALCSSLRVPVLFHTGHPLPVLDTDLSNPLLLLDVVRTFPDLPVWLGHAGAPAWWNEALTVAEAGPNVRLEMSVWLWDDSDHDAEMRFARNVVQAGRAVGLDRVIFGTDHVSGSKVRSPEFLSTILAMYRRLPQNAAALGMAVDGEQMAAILGGTAATDLAHLTTRSSAGQPVAPTLGTSTSEDANECLYN